MSLTCPVGPEKSLLEPSPEAMRKGRSGFRVSGLDLGPRVLGFWL